ncbi:MAG: nitroreductase family protein, partial [Candidatus Nanohaloarchaea archaeon]
ITGVKGFSSCRDEVIERKKMGRILEAGRFAPSPGKRQTIEFIVVEDHGALDHLSDILGDKRVEEAPTSVVIVTDPERMARRVKKPVEACYAEASASAQNMRVLASSEGLCSNLFTGFDEDSVANLLNVPSGKEPLAVVSFAYSDNPVEASDRFGMNEICFYDEYGKQIKSVFDGFEWEGIDEEKEKYMKKFRGLIQKIKSWG